jgi:hypothetical protein
MNLHTVNSCQFSVLILCHLRTLLGWIDYSPWFHVLPDLVPYWSCLQSCLVPSYPHVSDLLTSRCSWFNPQTHLLDCEYFATHFFCSTRTSYWNPRTVCLCTSHPHSTVQLALQSQTIHVNNKSVMVFILILRPVLFPVLVCGI